jgi:hypothetical protein
MKTVLLNLFLLISGVASAQNILDSIQLNEFPVRKGVIYKYEYKSNTAQVYASTLSIVGVVTEEDSVFHFEEGKVATVFTIDDLSTVIIRNTKNELITYSNLRTSNLKKGDEVGRGDFIGTTGNAYDPTIDRKQVDILVLQKNKRIPYVKTIQYIRYNMSKGNLSKAGKAYNSRL